MNSTLDVELNTTELNRRIAHLEHGLRECVRQIERRIESTNVPLFKAGLNEALTVVEAEVERRLAQSSPHPVHNLGLLRKIASVPVDHLGHAQYNCITGEDIRFARVICRMNLEQPDDSLTFDSPTGEPTKFQYSLIDNLT